MNQELYNKLFVRMDELGAIRKDLSLGCEIETCECNDWCCGIEEWVIGEKYWKCVWEKTSYIWAKFEINVMSVKWHPPVLSDCINAIHIRFPLSQYWKCPLCNSDMEHDRGQEPSHPETGQWDIEPSNYCSKWCFLSKEDADNAMETGHEFEFMI